jgi:acyl-CoA synthetase (AMP-forming)/AMP-acid ligase II/aryl carrier-like protein
MSDLGSADVAKLASPIGKPVPSLETSGPVFSSIKDLLAHHARWTPDRHAILSADQGPVTYRALWNETNNFESRLRQLGFGAHDRIAVVLPNGRNAAVAIVAVAASSVCVPLNPAYTLSEWQRYLVDLRVSALLTTRDVNCAGRNAAGHVGVPVLELTDRSNGDLFDVVGSTSAGVSRPKLAPNSGDAFVLLTSGTSMRPKMVPLAHSAVCRSAYNVGSTLALGSQDRLLNVLPLFHVHGLVSGLVTALAAGSSVVCTAGFDVTTFYHYLKEFLPTWYTAVPAIHQAVLSGARQQSISVRPCSLRVIRSASSTLHPSVVEQLESQFGVPVIDTYGMTEAASQIAANPMERRKPGSVGPAAGSEIAIMSEGRLLPAGQRGEVVLRGPTITRGYDSDPAATEAAFRDGWFRTGDLGYLDSDGYLFIVGRIKDIINRGGQKIAPSEVEQVLLSHPNVAEAAVFSISHPRLGEDVAAAVVLRHDAKVGARDLRDFASRHLVRYKVPGLIRVVQEIPKGPAGKIRRSELGAALAIALPEGQAGDGAEVGPPRSQLEWQVAKIVEELLELAHVGPEEDILALGADSITITWMLARLRSRFRTAISLKDIFDKPTIGAVVAHLDVGEGPPSAGIEDSQTGIARLPRSGPQPVSIVQERALRTDRGLLELPQFNRLLAYRLRGGLNVAALKQSLAELVNRHGALRTGFGWKNGSPVALVASAIEIGSYFAVEDLAPASVTGERPDALVLKKAELKLEQDALTHLNLNHAPLFRARLMRLGTGDHVLLLVLHEMIVDGWSLGVLLEELSESYGTLSAGRQSPMAEPPLQFSDFAHWQREWCTSPEADRQVAYWKERLCAISPVPAFNADDRDGPWDADVADEPINLPSDLVARLNVLSHSCNATLFMALLTGFKTLLLARSGLSDICVATPMANRARPRTERIVGPVANTALISTRLDPELSFEMALRRVRESVADTYAHQDIPFDILAARLAEEDGLDLAPLTQVSFVLQNAFRGSFELPGVEVQPFFAAGGQPAMSFNRTALAVTLAETQSGIAGAFRYKSGSFEPNTPRNWIAGYQTILARAAAEPGLSLGRLAELAGL